MSSGSGSTVSELTTSHVSCIVCSLMYQLLTPVLIVRTFYITTCVHMYSLCQNAASVAKCFSLNLTNYK